MANDSTSEVVDDVAPGAEGDLPSCEGCRRRKLRCSRQLPLCSNCEKYDTTCVYEQRRSKPGLKTGAVDALSRRLETIENHLFNRENSVEGYGTSQSATTSVVPPRPQSSEPDVAPVLGILTSLAAEIQKLNSNITASTTALNGNARYERSETPRSPNCACAVQRQQKRRRLNNDARSAGATLPMDATDIEPSAWPLPPDDVLNAVMDTYFPRVQPWLPILHEGRFRRVFHTAAGRQRNTIVLHAMFVATRKHLSYETLSIDIESAHGMEKRSRDWVLRSAMNGLSVENLQASTIIAFIDIGNGESSRAWPTIGSLTRCVQYLQLSVETADRRKPTAFLGPVPTLSKTTDWVEEEERRRVFWNIFNLDSWNTSLTAADVSRRLPVCGGKWWNETPAETPYFGIWGRSTASLGNSITFLPTHYESLSKSSVSDMGRLGPSPEANSHQRAQNASVPDMSNVGAFAYYIESLESLSRVNTYFLQQEVNFNNAQEVLSWLTRFKELDLRLVHWKMFLPSQWKDSGVSRETMPGIMDPNMTAANATHNVSMILLHQKIAYSAPELAGIKLPSSCSADTCLNAAVENTNIMSRFLEQSSRMDLVTPQLGFCAFISARLLLVHWKFYGGQLAPEFGVLVLGLEEMSRRWAGYADDDITTIFSELAMKLRHLQDRCLRQPEFTLDLCGASDEIAVGGNLNSTEVDHTTSNEIFRGNNRTWQDSEAQDIDHQNNDLTAMSEALMGSGFLNMERVISFDDMVFSDPDAGGSEMQWL